VLWKIEFTFEAGHEVAITFPHIKSCVCGPAKVYVHPVEKYCVHIIHLYNTSVPLFVHALAPARTLKRRL